MRGAGGAVRPVLRGGVAVKELTEKQQVFVYEYIQCWNASEAARRAGYKSKPNVQGARLLANDSIKALIDREIKTKAMGADEVLARLSDMARASLDDVLDPDEEFDLNLARATGKMHLVKKFKRTTRTEENGTTFRTTEIELHDAQSALVQLGKYHRLFSSVLEIRDWREVARKEGHDPEQIFRQLVVAARAAMDGAGDSGSDRSGKADTVDAKPANASLTPD